MQVYVPVSYGGPQDVSLLGTVYLGYIPTDLVDTLAAEIKAKNSAFYTGISGVPQQLALRVDSGFAINSIPDPNTSPGSNGTPPSISSQLKQAQLRQNAIIGVVTTLGAIAIIILVFLIYRSYKRRQELGHHRLSDAPQDAFAGQRPPGQDYDQDSVGGQRRRSFYYAEDSLRGFQAERQDEPAQISPTMRETRDRRPVVPAAISAPILRESSMNW